ncbi:MAG TPA: cytochrome c peroxidase [Burkholderiales bacterium]|nr:cytochrome c peroxidase [Burkholderiales bacterium]
MRRALLVLLLLPLAAGAQAPVLDFSDAEVRAILRHGPWPAPWAGDPTNRASGDREAIALGERLFFDPRLSPSRKVLCATCHVPYRGWQDGRARAFGLQEADRNTPSLLNVRYQRWYGWDGAGDSLWAQSVRPISDAREMGGSRAEAAALVRGDPELACRFAKVFGAPPPDADEAVLAGIGKALAAFQETLVSGRSPFDDFRDALEKGDRAAAARYPLAAQRGLRIFIGRGNCSVCHFGPNFTNGEFHDTGVPFFVKGGVDSGRHGGIRKLAANPLNLLGAYNDDRSGASALKTRQVALEHRNFGEFKVPSLRNVALTAPYMHNGSLATLADVVRHYSEVSPDRLHSDGIPLVKALHLSAQESADLIAFLESLTESASALPARKPASPCKG